MVVVETLAVFPAYVDQVFNIAVTVTAWAILSKICDSSLLSPHRLSSSVWIGSGKGTICYAWLDRHIGMLH